MAWSICHGMPLRLFLKTCLLVETENVAAKMNVQDNPMCKNVSKYDRKGVISRFFWSICRGMPHL